MTSPTRPRDPQAAIPPDAATEADSIELEEERPSRSEQTRAAASVNRLGLSLSTLSSVDLDKLDLPERLREEIDLCQRLKPRARGRQNRLIGQLLRAEDHEAIRERLDLLEGSRRDSVRHEKQNDQWLARILEEGESAVEALIERHPDADADRQRLRGLMRTARKDPDSKPARRARKELLRAVRALRG